MSNNSISVRYSYITITTKTSRAMYVMSRRIATANIAVPHIAAITVKQIFVQNFFYVQSFYNRLISCTTYETKEYYLAGCWQTIHCAVHAIRVLSIKASCGPILLLKPMTFKQKQIFMYMYMLINF